MKKTFLLLLIALFFSISSLFYFETSKAKSAQDQVELFSLVAADKSTTDSIQSPLSVAEVRKQEISINFDDINFEIAQRLSFPLLDGKSHVAIRRDSEGFVRLGPGEFSWRGKITGANGWSGDVILTVKDKSLSGLIYSENAVYEIIPQANFKHILVELDQSLFPPCAGALAAPENEPVPQTGSLDKGEGILLNSTDAAEPDNGSLLDIMVVYTAQVRTTLGGTTQTQSFIQQSISSTNTAYQNSGINPRLRLVHTMEVSYAEGAGTLSAALNWVRNDATVAAARNTAKADLVAIIIENASDGCGLASVQRTVGPGFAGSAFSATLRSCAIGNLSFAHEVGHNEGCEHNPENGASPSQASYPYAFGHYVSGSFRTVMSYADPCTGGCVRVPYFSNPSVTYNGFPTGITDQRDNRRVINNTALTISQFRESGGTNPPPPGQVNLTPFQPSGWSDKIVISKVTGTNTNGSPLTTNDTLYVDWAVVNNGSGPTAATFLTKLYVDGVERQTWNSPAPFNNNTYGYVQDYSIGKLSAGQHTIKIVTDTSGAIAETNETDNQYTRTITVTAPTAPNLTPFKPTGWSDKIVLSKTVGTTTDGTPFNTNDTLYVDWAVINNGDASTAATFSTRLYVDGVLRQTWNSPPPLNVNFYANVRDYSIGKLSAGQHTIKIVTDATAAIGEKNESDNEYTRTISVSPANLPNLTPFRPISWSDKIVVSKTTGTNADSTGLLSTDGLYVDWTVINNGDAPLPASFQTRLYVDGVLRQTWTTSPPLNQNIFTSLQDYSLGSLSAGQHTLKIVTDAGGVIAERNELDNEYSKVITVGAPAVVNTIQFSAQNYSFNEGTVNTPQGFGLLNITVTRTSSTSAATVQFATSDQAGPNECNQVTGQASQRCDYAAQGGTLRFSAGEGSKVIQIPIINDGYIEGNEVFSIRLQNPTGASLGINTLSTITILDRGVSTQPTANPYLSNGFFVRMNYLDFLAREPDAQGWPVWLSTLNNCGPQQGFLGAPHNCDRAHVSHGFYGSPEFTNAGFLVYRMYEVGMGRLPRFAEFTPDMATLSGFGLSDAVKQQNVQDYIQRFSARQEFINRFSDALQPSQAATLIQKLETAAGIQLPATATTLPGQPTQYGRDELIQKRQSGQFTVGQTLKAFVEQQAVYDRFFPRGQVTMLYFAYLKRDPDLNDPGLLGWNEWVFVFTNGGAARGRPDILPRDIHHLIFGFIYSTEYRKRFGQP